MQDPDEITAPGGPLLLEGPMEARQIAELAVLLRFYASQLEQMAGEARRAPMEPAKRDAMWLRMRSLATDFAKTALMLAPWHKTTPARR